MKKKKRGPNPIPEDRRKDIVVAARVTYANSLKLRRLADLDGRKMSGWLSRFLSQYLDAIDLPPETTNGASRES